MDVFKAESNRKIARPQFNIKFCLKILRFTGTWPPKNSRFIQLMFIAYSLCIYSVTVGFLIFVEIMNVFFNYNNFGKIASCVPLFLTNVLHSYKVLEIKNI